MNPKTNKNNPTDENIAIRIDAAEQIAAMYEGKLDEQNAQPSPQAEPPKTWPEFERRSGINDRRNAASDRRKFAFGAFNERRSCQERRTTRGRRKDD